MKVVVNAQYGGFSLSMLAEQEYLKRKGEAAYFYKLKNRTCVSGPYVRTSPDDKPPFVWYTYTRDLGDDVEHLPDDSYFNSRPLPRNDTDLVAVVEELGNSASGRHATLAIVDIPDGIEWHIEEYDGTEHIAEKHRCWYPNKENSNE